jgi:hypothetical protein
MKKEPDILEVLQSAKRILQGEPPEDASLKESASLLTPPTHVQGAAHSETEEKNKEIPATVIDRSRFPFEALAGGSPLFFIVSLICFAVPLLGLLGERFSPKAILIWCLLGGVALVVTWYANRCQYLSALPPYSRQRERFRSSSSIISLLLIYGISYFAVSLYIPASALHTLWGHSINWYSLICATLVLITFLYFSDGIRSYIPKLFCPHCGNYIDDSRPWRCGHGEHSNGSSCLGPCLECHELPKTLICPHPRCGKDISLNGEHDAEHKAEFIFEKGGAKSIEEERREQLAAEEFEIARGSMRLKNEKMNVEILRVQKAREHLQSPKTPVSLAQTELNGMLDDVKGAKAKMELLVKLRKDWTQETANLPEDEQDEARGRMEEILKTAEMKYHP